MGLYKVGKVWKMCFMHNGRQVRRSTGTGDKRLAEKIYAKAVAQVAEGKWLERPLGEDRTLSELFDKYIAEYTAPNKAKRTVRQERRWAKEMLKFFGDIPLAKVTPGMVSAYKARCRKKGHAPATINLQRGFLSHVFKKAVLEWEWASRNPVERVGREKVRNARDRWLTLDEEKRLIEACVIHVTCKDNVQEPRYWLQEIVVFDLNTGMRQDEVLSLQWPHVDLFRRTVTVMRSKNGEKRTIPLNRTAFELLKAKARGRDITEGYVFASEAGTKILARNLHRGFYGARDRAKIKDFRFHDLRHTFATRLAQAGVDIYKIARLLGHKDIKMTQRYAHHYPESLRDGVEVLDAIRDENFITILSHPAQNNEKGATGKPVTP